jgi:nucleotide-binding universal stress UspA family protein
LDGNFQLKKEGIGVEKKILLAVDNSIHSRKAVQYVLRMSSTLTDLSFMLFHVQPTISLFLREEAEKDFKAKAELKRVIQKNTDDSLALLEKTKSEMVRMGIEENKIGIKTRSRMLGVAKDIIEYAQQGLYDAVVVGRRGLSRMQKAFMGSLTSNLVEHSRIIPLWIVDGDVSSMSFMLAVDGSESSLRAVDHLSFVVGANPEIKITLFHVMPRLGDYCVIDFDDKEGAISETIQNGSRRCLDDFNAKARKIFNDSGVHEDQVEIKVAKPTVKVGKAIVDEAIKGSYGTVVIGRSGINQAFFMGRVSRYVIERITNSALWVVG